MSLNEFRKRFEEEIHRLLWRQWSRLGVAGMDAGDDRAILDPEAMILFTIEAARTEPRLFDEMIDWLLRNGQAIDVQRLRNILRQDSGGPARLLAAVASLLAEHETSAKWIRLAEPPAAVPKEREPLFLLGNGRRAPEPRSRDPRFDRAGYVRSPFVRRQLSSGVPRMSPACLRFRFRAFFGIGIRSEITAFLLTHEGGVNGDAVARAIGFSPPGVQEALREMETSNLVLSRREGREKRYFLDRDRWWGFLGLADRARAELDQHAGDVEKLSEARSLLPMKGRGPKARHGMAEHMVLALAPPATWVNWARLFRGLAAILRFLRRPDFERMTEYVRSSEFAMAAKAATDDLEGAGLAFHLPRQEGGDLEEHIAQLTRAIESLVGEL